MNAVREASEADADAIAAIYAPYVDTPISFEAVAPGAVQFRRRMALVQAEYPWLLACEGERVLGYAYASKHRMRPAYRWSVEVSAYVAADAHRRGIGRRLYTTLFELLRLQGFAMAYAGITLPNPASVGLHEALGFRAVGVYPNVGFKRGVWHDVGWWHLQLGELGQTPPLPLPMAQLRADSAAKALLGVSP
ncbi:MAG: GNAT family N-acetyltransferase [Myxococcales bacterium]|nr:GNAT family N-acetyltransferase [Myxococcales bacterium]